MASSSAWARAFLPASRRLRPSPQDNPLSLYHCAHRHLAVGSRFLRQFQGPEHILLFRKKRQLQHHRATALYTKYTTTNPTATQNMGVRTTARALSEAVSG